MKKLIAPMLVVLMTGLFSACESNNHMWTVQEEEIMMLSDKLGVKLKIDKKVNPEKAIHFNSIAELETFILEIESRKIEFPEEDEILSRLQGIGNDRCPELNGHFVASHNEGPFDINFGINVSNGNVNNVNPYLSGITFMNSYTDGGYGVSDYGDQTIIHTSGAINYDLFIQGIGTIYSSIVGYKIILGCGGVLKIVNYSVLDQ